MSMKIKKQNTDSNINGTNIHIDQRSDFDHEQGSKVHMVVAYV